MKTELLPHRVRNNFLLHQLWKDHCSSHRLMTRLRCTCPPLPLTFPEINGCWSLKFLTILTQHENPHEELIHAKTKSRASSLKKSNTRSHVLTNTDELRGFNNCEIGLRR